MRDVKAYKASILICETNDPLGPTRSIECEVLIDENKKLAGFKFAAGTPAEDIIRMTEIVNDPAWRMDFLIVPETLD